MKDLWTHRKFILKLLAFTAVFFVINTPVNNAYTRWSRQTSLYEISRKQFEAEQDQVSIVFIGDSHGGHGVDSRMFVGGYNFSTGGENMIQSYYKIRYYLERNFRPEVAVLPIDLHSFSSFRADRFNDPAFWKQHIDYWELGWFKGEPLNYLELWLTGQFAYLGGLEEVVDRKLNPVYPDNRMVNGFVPWKGTLLDINDQELQQMVEKRAARYFEDSDPLDSDLLAYFLRLVDLLEAHQVEVVLVSYPVTEWYYEEAGKYFPLEDYYGDIEKALAVNGNQVVMLDYFNLFWGRDDLFTDSDHLNAEGAAQLTAQIIEDLAALGVLP